MGEGGGKNIAYLNEAFVRITLAPLSIKVIPWEAIAGYIIKLYQAGAKAREKGSRVREEGKGRWEGR